MATVAAQCSRKEISLAYKVILFDSLPVRAAQFSLQLLFHLRQEQSLPGQPSSMQSPAHLLAKGLYFC